MVARAAAERIEKEIAEGRAGELGQLLPELLFAVLAPYLGGERAARESRGRPARSGPLIGRQIVETALARQVHHRERLKCRENRERPPRPLHIHARR